MSYTYDRYKRPRGQQTAPPERTSAPGPGMDVLMAGQAQPSAAQKGQPFDLDATMKARMENAFGDLSAVKFYKSRAVGDAGAEAVAQGSEIAFAPGMADFSTRAGRERLGHELSHVMSQRSGGVRGRGFLADPALEARADREGALAAAGAQVYTGPVISALSAASPPPAAAGPMQAKRNGEQEYKAKWKAENPKHMPAYMQSMDLPKDDPNKKEKRPWEITAEELRANHFNPTNSTELAQHQAVVDIADSPKDAYSTFSYMAGSPSVLTKENAGQWNPYEVDPDHFKSKLKNMLRVVHDYPELKGKIGNMKEMPAPVSVMAAGTTAGGKNKAELSYNPTIDSMSFWGKIKHTLFHTGNKLFGITNQSDMEYTGTHELGHVLNSLLLNPKNEDDADNDWNNSITADSIVDAALKQVMPEEEYNNLKRYKRTNEKKGRIRGQLDLSGSKLYKKGHTSRYGQTNASEFFAEAFADVYTHGADAKPASKAVVQEYERRRDEMKNRPEVEGLENIPDDDPLVDDPLNTSMIVHDDRRRKKKES